MRERNVEGDGVFCLASCRMIGVDFAQTCVRCIALRKQVGHLLTLVLKHMEPNEDEKPPLLQGPGCGAYAAMMAVT